MRNCSVFIWILNREIFRSFYLVLISFWDVTFDTSSMIRRTSSHNSKMTRTFFTSPFLGLIVPKLNQRSRIKWLHLNYFLIIDYFPTHPLLLILNANLFQRCLIHNLTFIQWICYPSIRIFMHYACYYFILIISNSLYILFL